MWMGFPSNEAFPSTGEQSHVLAGDARSLRVVGSISDRGVGCLL